MPDYKQGLPGQSSLGAGASAPGPLGYADAAHAIDTLKASLESAFVGMDRHMPNDILIREAGDIVNKLLSGSIPGMLEQASAARRFLKMRDVLEERLSRAPLDEHFLPRLEGVKWKVDDPLAGIVEGISPFHMADWISTFIAGDDAGRVHLRRNYKRPKVQQPAGTDQGTKPAANPSTTADPWAKTKVPSSKGIGDGLKPPKDSGVTDAAVDLTLEALLNVLELEMAGVFKTAFDSLTSWVNALREGVQISTRRFAIKFLPHVVANVAAGIKGAPKVTERTVGGGTFKVKGKEVDWSSMTIPAPALNAEIKKRIWNADEWHSPSDRVALDDAEKMAVARAQKFLDSLNSKQNGARLYLWMLNKRHKGDYMAIMRHVAEELRKGL